MDHQHGAQPLLAGQRPELEGGDVAGPRRQAMLAGIGKQAGGARRRPFASRAPSLFGIWRPAEKLEGDPPGQRRGDMLARAEAAS